MATLMFLSTELLEFENDPDKLNSVIKDVTFFFNEKRPIFGGIIQDCLENNCMIALNHCFDIAQVPDNLTLKERIAYYTLMSGNE